jgi:rare lipoprotein A
MWRISSFAAASVALSYAAMCLDVSAASVGIASYYGAKHQGRRTASGERFDLNGLTAAHRSIPLGSQVDVTNLANGRTVTVRVNDRGPYAAGRIIDVSRRAAGVLGFVSGGTAPVRISTR